MPNQDINSISPKLRDNLLNQNIGKYSQVTIPLINPIGKQIDVYNSTPILKKSITGGDLLNYTNENIQNDYYSQYRDLDSNIVNYIKTKNKYTKDNTYIDETSKSIVDQSTNAVLSYLLGGEVNVGINNGNQFQISPSFDYGNTLPGLALGVASGSETKLGEVGLRSLGLQLANSVLDKTRRSEAVLKFLETPLEYYDAIDKLDTEKLNLSTNFSNIIGGTFPIYLYSEVKNSTTSIAFQGGTKEFHWVNKGYDQGTKTEVKNSLISEDGTTTNIENLNFTNQSLLYKTQKMFESGKIKTLVSHFDDNADDGTIITKGRPLKRRDVGDPINKPYFRSWTASTQYRNARNLMRPFNDADTLILEADLKRVRPGAKNLKTYGVLQDDGFVKMSPYSDFNSKTDVHKYMFSIENMAWKRKEGFLDSLIQGSSQDGPNGGRIMWFPPYDIKFTDNTSVNWNSDNFIGRGEPVYTYVNTERSGSLNFKVIVDYPSIINYYKQKNSDDIKDDDYYRFFAGKDIIELENTEPTKDNTPPQESSKPITESKPDLIYEFKTYFPNNFSGIDLISNPNIFLNYLLHGENCDDSLYAGQGYEFEVNNNYGLTLASFPSGETCQGNFAHKVDSAYEKQSVHHPNNRDINSFGLNSTKYNNNPATISFKEFVGKVKFEPTTEQLNKFRSIKKIVISGYASNQGYAKTNNDLAINRGKIMGAWLKLYDYFFSKDLKIEYRNLFKQTNDNLTNNSTSSVEIKKERCALIQMYSTSDATPVIESGYGENKQPTIPASTPLSNNSGTATRQKVDMYGYTTKDNNANLENDEAKFFERIGRDGDLVMEEFSKQIKYFHPAFHSTTPEGFNARLTFLHQCTRQGNTSPNNAGLATNLAFGRPPICILRIGDFYNTKVIFDNLNIDFEPLVWDLNQEGIGVQPMLANITMSFKFIGGSDLTGPIARLQNAITFNFFANTGVYDDRNDRFITDPETGQRKRNQDTGLLTDKYYPMYNPGVYDNQTSQDTTPNKETGVNNNISNNIKNSNQNPISQQQKAYVSKYGYTYDVLTQGPRKMAVVKTSGGDPVLDERGDIIAWAWRFNRSDNQILMEAKAALNDNIN